MQHHLNTLIEHYGYFGIILVLIGGIIGLPIPDEVLLTFVGYNVFLGKMMLLPSLISAFAGSSVGITISYFLGRKLGLPFLRKFGPKMHITETRLNKTAALFKKMGPYLLFIGYFLPGIRHVTAYLAGINRYTFKKFALFAYTGAAFWSITFILLGKTLGHQWHKVEFFISKYSMFAIPLFIILLVLAGFYLQRKKSV
ncbi:MAG: DedA family protein [Bacillota bacterium]|nr:DedA family protein [Bacillota bacterium]